MVSSTQWCGEHFQWSGWSGRMSARGPDIRRNIWHTINVLKGLGFFFLNGRSAKKLSYFSYTVVRGIDINTNGFNYFGLTCMPAGQCGQKMQGSRVRVNPTVRALSAVHSKPLKCFCFGSSCHLTYPILQFTYCSPLVCCVCVCLCKFCKPF